jgi:hypothetical protein
MTLKLTDEALKEFREKLEKSVVDRRLFYYIFNLRFRNYEAFDRLVMILLDFGEVAFVYALTAVRAMERPPNG